MAKPNHHLGISSLSWTRDIRACENAVLEECLEDETESTEPELPVNRAVYRDAVSFQTRGENRASHDWEVPVGATLKEMGYDENSI